MHNYGVFRAVLKGIKNRGGRADFIVLACVRVYVCVLILTKVKIVDFVFHEGVARRTSFTNIRRPLLQPGFADWPIPDSTCTPSHMTWTGVCFPSSSRTSCGQSVFHGYYVLIVHHTNTVAGYYVKYTTQTCVLVVHHTTGFVQTATIRANSANGLTVGVWIFIKEHHTHARTPTPHPYTHTHACTYIHTHTGINIFRKRRKEVLMCRKIFKTKEHLYKAF